MGEYQQNLKLGSSSTSALGMMPSNGNTSVYNSSTSQLKGKALRLNQSAAQLMSNKKNQFVNDKNDATLQTLNGRVAEELN